MGKDGYIEILILLDGKQHGMRYWPTVPRVGELLEISESQDVRVIQVLWRHQDLKAFGRGECKVTLWVERVRGPIT